MRKIKTVLITTLVLNLASLLAAQSSIAASDEDQIVGTYSLVRMESRDSDGNWQPITTFDRVGYITYSNTGYMGVALMPLDRTPFAANPPTPAEAQQALRGHIAYFGSFTVHEDEKFVVHHRAGQINPGGTPEAKRFYDLEGDRLILTVPTANGDKQQATTHVIWQRLPDAQLSAEAQKFVGFRQLTHIDRYTERNGSMVTHGDRNENAAGSYVIYTPTGHMMVHLMQKDRSTSAGATPTPEEALAAYRSYTNYFGPFSVYENADPPYVVHEQIGQLNPRAPSDQLRLYLIDGDVLRLGPRPQVRNGESRGTHLYWEELPSLR